MQSLLWGWVAGMLPLLWWPALPSPHGAWLVLAAGLCGLCGDLRWRRLGWFCGGCAAGLAWSVLAASASLMARLPLACEGRVLVMTGVISGLPEPAEPSGRRFRFRPSEPGPCLPGAGEWQLSWRQAGELRPGESWRLTVRLKRPHTLYNPGGFDGERHAHAGGVVAVGVVKSGRFLRAGGGIDDLRWRIRQRLLPAFPAQPEAAGMVLALLTGDRVGMTGEAWARYSRTGITHLVAISGTHIVMVAVLAGWLVRRGWLLLPGIALRVPASRVAAPCGLLAAIAYGLLAGMELPAQRTLLMLSAVVLMRWLPGETGLRQILLAALALVLLRDPLAIHDVGLWLSFTAVALLMAGGLHGREEGGWRAALRAQWLATWGLMPLTLALFARVSWISLPVNVVAIPLVTFVIVPLAMAGLVADSLLPSAGMACWSLAVSIADWLDRALQWAAGLPGVASDLALPGALPWCLALALGLLLMPRRLPGRWLAPWPLLALAWPQPVLAPGQLRVVFLDVGQGLSVLVQTAGHQLLFDTGPPMGPRADAGSRVILPYLRWADVAALDVLVFSHDDLDHTGGGGAVLAGLPVRQVLGVWPSLLKDMPVASRPPWRGCRAGEHWVWDGVRFDWLWPDPAQPMPDDNNNSCVLRVSAPGGSVLIPGDLERAGEQRLLALSPAGALRADVLALGHHGSNTSTTAAWLAAVRPREAVAAVGYRNRYRHPAPAVLARLQAAGIPGWRSDLAGALRYDFLTPGQPPEVRRWRVEHPHYWLRPASGRPSADHGEDLSMLGALGAFP